MIKKMPPPISLDIKENIDEISIGYEYSDKYLVFKPDYDQLAVYDENKKMKIAQF
jgi:hypothetical protein